MAFSTNGNHATPATRPSKISTFLTALLRRNDKAQEAQNAALEAPQELNSRYFYEREQAARRAQAQRDVNRIWY